MHDDDAFAGEPFWDNAAPYTGPHGYAECKGEPVPGRVTAAIQFRMERSEQCIARGVMLMDDESVYTWTVRRERHADMNGRRRLATRTRRTFREAAAGLLEFERRYIDPDLYAHYADQVAKINF